MVYRSLLETRDLGPHLLFSQTRHGTDINRFDIMGYFSYAI